MMIPDGFDPKPTVFTGGLERMIKIWESSRDVNDGGYGGGVLQHVTGWGTPSSHKTTSCSPFTATVIGMLFDSSGASDATTKYNPMYDGGQTPLPVDYYVLHNGFYFQVDSDVPNSAAIIAERKARFHAKGWPLCDDSADATVFFNLGYAIDSRDMRRGDLVGIDWASGHGHATFCWDVHCNDNGEVDCFSFLSANGYKAGGAYHGAGVSVSTANPEHFVVHDGGAFKKTRTLFVDSPDYIKHSKWYCLPGVRASSVNTATFHDPGPEAGNIIDKTAGGNAVARMRVVRFWGFPPPVNPHGTRLGDKGALATQLARWPLPPSYATGTGPVDG
ncbi:MAG: hypothetical protein E6J90_17550 [Deltaproteobacteria bacterium]|nr:MAG: hypothetical protein E6J91_13745 [Deltaproteobacteria bacterium]TMQ19622.1 MAG: hypothetical protein E6J90_17550 [Deltaproteobacteria bacterium]